MARLFRTPGQTVCADCPVLLDPGKAPRCRACALAQQHQTSRRHMRRVYLSDPEVFKLRSRNDRAWARAAREVEAGITDPPASYPAWWVFAPPPVRPRLTAPPWVPRPCDLIARAVRQQSRVGPSERPSPSKVLAIPFEVGR